MRDAARRSTRFAKQLRKEMTDAEVILWSFIRRRAHSGVKFRRQHPIGQYIADFACVSAKLVVEVDGATHWTAEQLAHDERRSAFLKSQGWRVLRVANADVFTNMDGVSLAVADLLTQAPHAEF